MIVRVIADWQPDKLISATQLTEKNTKQLPKVQLLGLEVLEQTDKGLGKNKLLLLPQQFTQNGGVH